MEKTIDDYYSSGLLKSDDIKEDTKLTITKVEPQKIGSDEKEKLVVSFDEIDENLVLNTTNAGRIAKITGTKSYTQWAGTVITLYTIWTTFKKEEVKAIRVREKPKE